MYKSFGKWGYPPPPFGKNSQKNTVFFLEDPPKTDESLRRVGVFSKEDEKNETDEEMAKVQIIADPRSRNYEVCVFPTCKEDF